ncbi:GIY-YIG nuclease family protein [Echinicola salinicaeni]|uniref:GIY-YIG nuclease family protein n=1 Tax=Echinicola salinicaeni TaxID=2762757 RepID=UPI00293BF532|nr:GIY-YIG nuclease family protein [Echinicola salinicaeni]
MQAIFILVKMYFVYILYSTKTFKYYTGSCNDIDERLYHHNRGLTPSTKSGAPNWELKYIEEFSGRSDALKRERQIKKKKSRKYIEWLINSSDSVG